MSFGELARNDAAHYPDTLAHIFVVNAPYLFSALATAISPFMDPDTYSKVHIYLPIALVWTVCLSSWEARERIFSLMMRRRQYLSILLQIRLDSKIKNEQQSHDTS
mmetsp:Transcript_5361/g.11671  ORF Transcript_5361/g.11671 Transcript_5361/m.11671 type:complete len:106 (+) Transcript_5361:2707-3024(+)